ncbi:unnamed protein product [Angiostrongylus costaricensis]|uniref:BH4_AAA_HYDROXYL_2 domain-containing protein n=1 Tax=Angiostrongylus costaricensis TaxID=334426 RepID=A0A0R3PZK9_ANGCS|nr:unnamed protein product [Angiostrongylus costaricensis]
MPLGFRERQLVTSTSCIECNSVDASAPFDLRNRFAKELGVYSDMVEACIKVYIMACGTNLDLKSEINSPPEEWAGELLSFHLSLQTISETKRYIALLRHMFSGDKERIPKYVLRIPRHVTLPEREYTYRFLFFDDPDAQALSRQNAKLAKCIVEYRTALKELNELIQEVSDAADILATLIERLQRASLDVTDNPVGDSYVNTLVIS